MTRIENLEVAAAQGERNEPPDDPMFEAQMARLDASIERMEERAEQKRTEDTEDVAQLAANTKAMDEMNAALQRVLKVYRGI